MDVSLFCKIITYLLLQLRSLQLIFTMEYTAPSICFVFIALSLKIYKVERFISRICGISGKTTQECNNYFIPSC